MKRNPARMKYQKDSLSSLFCILGIVFNVYYFVSSFGNDAIAPDIVMGADVLINIVFMMLVFLASEKLKAYGKNWPYIVFGLGVLELARIGLLPAHYLRLGMLTGAGYWKAVAGLSLSGLMLMLAGVNAYINARLLRGRTDSPER